MNDDKNSKPGLPDGEENELQDRVNETLGPKEKPITGEVHDDDKVVDEIVAKEGDELIEAHDERLAESFKPETSGKWDKIKDFFARWWQNPVARWSTIAGAVLLFVAAWAIPPSRYFMLNTAGVRSKASLSILDESTQQPLKNVEVSLGGQKAQTDKDGNVKLEHVRLGSSQLVIEKRGFATSTRKVVVGWGSNPLGTMKLTPQGTQFVLSVTDFLSKKPVAKAEASSGDASALSDDKGVIKLTIDKPEDMVEVSVKLDGYREEKAKFSSSTKDTQNIKLVPDRKHAFVSKRSGKYDTYKIDADGKNESLALAGTGSERDDITLVVNPAKNVAALVSTRDNVRNSDGYLLSTLTLINLKDNGTIKIIQSERVQVIGWSGNKLVYVQIAAGTSGANAKRNRIMSYDYGNREVKELAAANYFNDMQLVGSKLYYAPSSAYQPAGSAGLFKVEVDGTNKQNITSEETWSISRISYDHLTLSAQQKWMDYQISNSKLTTLNGAPANPSNRIYADSPDGKRTVWVDSRDGKGVMLSFDQSANKDTAVRTQNGLTNPVTWLSDSVVVYRIANGQETADYVMSIDGGDAQKLKDVTNTTGIDRWYYY
jgi:hypothetical protein